MLPSLSLAALLALPAMVIGAPTTKPFPAELATEVVPEGDFHTEAKQIVGGVEASAGDFPYIVSLSRSGSHFCGGSLLNAYTVITAAHCSTGVSPSSVRVRAGSLRWASGGTQVGVSQILVHPSYSSSTTNNDIALWRLSSPIQSSSSIGYVTLPASGSDPSAGTLTTVAGWGTTSSGGSTLPATLRKVTVPVISRDTCRANYGSSAITTAMFCAGETNGGEDSCQGDSGGPIVTESSRVLQGIVSWGRGCALAGFPGVYTRVGNFVSWINSNRWTS